MPSDVSGILITHYQGIYKKTDKYKSHRDKIDN